MPGKRGFHGRIQKFFGADADDDLIGTVALHRSAASDQIVPQQGIRLGAEQGWVLGTNNAIEFCGRYRAIEFHPGIVLIVASVVGPEQVRLFTAALRYIRQHPNLINRALDVSIGGQNEPCVAAYDLP